MLRYLRIRELAVVADVEIQFGDGLNLLTGETGAGKSIVVDALGLVLGDRAAADRVRAGGRRAVVEAVLRLARGDPARDAVVRAGIDLEDEDGADLVIRREVAADGSRAFVNGCPVTVATLRGIGDLLFDIHGQHEHLSLLHPREQLELLDAFAGASELRREVAAAHADLAALQERLRALREDRAAIEERLEVLRFRLREFAAVSPRPGEEEELRRERARLAHGSRIAELAAEGGRLLEGDDGGAVLRDVARLESVLEELAGYLPDLAEAREQARSARYGLQEAAARLRDLAAEPEEPSRREAVEERLSALAGLARKHGGSLEAAIASAERCRAELESLEAAAGDPEAVERDLAAAAARYAEAAGGLSARRRDAAARLRRALAAELRALALGGARVEIAVEREERPGSPVRAAGVPVAFDARGIDRVEFRLAANPGEEVRPLARVASGGELSRLMLALECARLGGSGVSPRRLVFDEVDAGIGGRAAAAIGERLHRVSRERQVLCVTHLPQIAARADRHFAVEKQVADGRAVTRVRALDAGGRVAEIARMLGGERVTDATRRHAEELVGGSRRVPGSRGEAGAPVAPAPRGRGARRAEGT